MNIKSIVLFATLAGLAASGRGQTLGTSPSAGHNYIITYTVRQSGITTPSSGSNTPAQVNPVIQYFDDLGRPDQSVAVQGSPALKDMVQPQTYNYYGQEEKKYLPYASSGTDGSYKSSVLGTQAGFYYPSPPSGVATIDYAYSELGYENSPLNRVAESGAPGSAWQISNGHTVKTVYGANGSSEVVLWTLSGTTLTNSGYYSAATLTKTTMKDENWTSTNAGITEEFKDTRGRVVLKRVWEDASTALSTYYVYDKPGNLAYVIPPAVTATFDETYTSFDQYVYAYHYDSRNRLVEKKIPGKGWEYMVYNKMDQVILSQDANLRASSDWLMTKYDAHGRVAITGIYNNGNGRSTVQSSANGVSTQWEDPSGSGNGYSANTYPTSWSTTLTINYYDDYSFPNGTTYAYGSASSQTMGLQTGSLVNVLGTGDYLLSIIFYDDEGRVAQTAAEHYKGGSVSTGNYDETTNTYDFTGALLTSTRLHKISSSTALTTVTEYDYDHTGRKVNTWETINGGTRTLLAQADYNAIGQLTDKKLHSEDNGSNFIETIDYTYNPRSWITEISSPKLDYKLFYDSPALSGSQAMYNGNISEARVNSNYTGDKRFYYIYDKLNRLTESRYHSSTSHTAQMDEEIAYNSMGNITSLIRGSVGGLGFSYSGTLSYDYTGTGNRLNAISGGVSRSYGYDGNGNATSDGTTSFSYNILNLPSVVTNGSTVTYKYDATGRKLRKIVSGGNTRDYDNGIEYLNGSIDFVATDEGRATAGSPYHYEYMLKDHLGNVRSVIEKNTSSSSAELQASEYYAFGLDHTLYDASTNNKHAYNGKELQDEFQQYDYGARFYDPVIGRWNSIDPLAEISRKWSPYNYVEDNPIRNIDPDGMAADQYNGGFLLTGEEAQAAFRQYQQTHKDDKKEPDKPKPDSKSSPSWVYTVPVWGEAAKAGDSWNDGNYGQATLHELTGFLELALFTEKSAVSVYESFAGMFIKNATKGGVPLVEALSKVGGSAAVSDFLGWGNKTTILKSASDFTKNQLIKAGYTKQVLTDIAAGLREAAKKTIESTGELNPSSIARAHQVEQIIKTHF